MRKYLILLIVFVCTLCWADVYKVDNFRGGMNLEDSTDLANNEALSIKNMTLEGGNLVSRHGWGQWNATAIDTIYEVTNCFVYQPDENHHRLIIAAGHYHLYKTPTLAGVSNWPAVAFKIADTAYVDDETLFVSSDIWPRLKTDMLDSVYLACSPESANTIDNSFSINDTAIILSKNSGVDDSANVYYEIWKNAVNPGFSQYKDKLYISGGYGSWNSGYFAMVYNDTDYMFLGVIDTGVVSDTIDMQDTSTIIFNEGFASLPRNTNKVKIMGPNANNIPSAEGVEAGMIFYINRGTYPDGERHYSWQSLIDSVYSDTITPYSGTIDTAIYWYLELEDLLPDIYGGYFGSYEIKRNYWACGFASYAIEDSTKNWLDIDYASSFLQAMYFQPANSDTVFNIYCNGENYVAINGNLDIGDRYYIYSMLPYYLLITDNDLTQFPFLDQLIFNKERLWAVGNSYSRYMVGGGWINFRGDVNTVWYSDPAYPEYIKYNYNFSIGNNERLTCAFELRGDLYFASANAIWRQGANIGDIEKVANTGFSDKKAWAEGAGNIGYFANDEGIYQFNGGSAQKISREKGFNIEAFHAKYKKSRLVLGYKNDILYISYPDSGVTLYHDIKADFWSYFDFGMNFIMTSWAGKDTSIFLFGNPDYPGRIFYYPTSVYYDSTASQSKTFECEYLGGRQSYGAFEYPKSIDELNISIQTEGPATGYIYINHSDSACDTVVLDSTGNYIFNEPAESGCRSGDYVQLGVRASAGQRVVLYGIKAVYTWRPKQYSE